MPAKWLDAHPEPSWKQRDTTAYLAGVLDERGVSYRTLGAGDRVVALRADIDAVWFGDAETGRAVHAAESTGVRE